MTTTMDEFSFRIPIKRKTEVEKWKINYYSILLTIIVQICLTIRTLRNATINKIVVTSITNPARSENKANMTKILRTANQTENN